MAVTTYVNMGDEVFGELTGGVRSNYVRDALGSVVAVTDTSNAKLYSARYKPYGGTLSSTGTPPRYTWCGVWGYDRAAGSSHVEFKVGARFYGSQAGRWTSVDPLWPYESGYGYVANRIINKVDPSGLKLSTGEGCPPLTSCCDKIAAAIYGDGQKPLMGCLAKKGYGGASYAIGQLFTLLLRACDNSNKTTVVCIHCSSSSGGAPPNWPANCANPCQGDTKYDVLGSVVVPFPQPIDTVGTGCKQFGPSDLSCEETRVIGTDWCGGSGALCLADAKGRMDTCSVLIHELGHVLSDLGHTGENSDLIKAMGCCLCESQKPKEGCRTACQSVDKRGAH